MDNSWGQSEDPQSTTKGFHLLKSMFYFPRWFVKGSRNSALLDIFVFVCFLQRVVFANGMEGSGNWGRFWDAPESGRVRRTCLAWHWAMTIPWPWSAAKSSGAGPDLTGSDGMRGS